MLLHSDINLADHSKNSSNPLISTSLVNDSLSHPDTEVDIKQELGKKNDSMTEKIVSTPCSEILSDTNIEEPAKKKIKTSDEHCTQEIDLDQAISIQEANPVVVSAIDMPEFATKADLKSKRF